ncbi:phosphatase PAP2 family protein [Shewanella sp. JM162201]|uniref:Acid phosphatase n=2 Tax=Shewanella jiangmenensis TaxID=2837387 RepID=A0ABS5V300_9GAMM|nr:phosphatase PAP2 family protein [Shewanella jiangmenensis]
MVTVAELRPGYLTGYLDGNTLPNSLELVAPPPAEGSASAALDLDIATRMQALKGTPRWQLAISDANLHFPAAAGIFSCALNAPISEAQTPRLYQLLRRTLTDAGLSTYKAKNHYQRSRPFMVNQQGSCSPDEEAALAKNGSYPSGHTAIGWAWALVLAEIAPEQADALLARGLAFGESRNVCNVHWHSDVVTGRTLGAATVARLHANPQFQADLAAAKAEVAALHAANTKAGKDFNTGSASPTDCAAEAAALAIRP